MAELAGGVRMGEYSVLNANAVCPSCRQPARFRVSFRYGQPRQNPYAIGDPVEWGGDADVGLAGARKVIVEGIGGPCAHCRAESLEFEIWLHRDRIEGVTPAEQHGGTRRTVGYTIVEL